MVFFRHFHPLLGFVVKPLHWKSLPKVKMAMRHVLQTDARQSENFRKQIISTSGNRSTMHCPQIGGLLKPSPFYWLLSLSLSRFFGKRQLPSLSSFWQIFHHDIRQVQDWGYNARSSDVAGCFCHICIIKVLPSTWISTVEPFQLSK